MFVGVCFCVCWCLFLCLLVSVFCVCIGFGVCTCVIIGVCLCMCLCCCTFVSLEPLTPSQVSSQSTAQDKSFEECTQRSGVVTTGPVCSSVFLFFENNPCRLRSHNGLVAE